MKKTRANKEWVLLELNWLFFKTLRYSYYTNKIHLFWMKCLQYILTNISIPSEKSYLLSPICNKSVLVLISSFFSLFSINIIYQFIRISSKWNYMIFICYFSLGLGESRQMCSEDWAYGLCACHIQSLYTYTVLCCICNQVGRCGN